MLSATSSPFLRTMPRVLLLSLFTLAAAALSMSAQQTIRSQASSTTPQQVLSASAAHPTVFIENRGQWAQQARYLLRTRGLNVWVTNTGLTYDLYRNERLGKYDPSDETQTSPQVHSTGHVVAMEFIGTSADAQAHGTDQQPGYYNYFLGDRSHWATDVPLFSGARINRLYPGIDAVVMMEDGRPRYDLLVAPDADPSQIAMQFKGATKVQVGKGGVLEIGTSMGTVEQRKLYAYQVVDGERRPVHCAFTVNTDGTVRFTLGIYDRTLPLVIDPLVFSTYLGGTVDDIALAMTTDDTSNIYITGQCDVATGGGAVDYPVTTGAYDASHNNNEDVFVTKLNPGGSALIFSTFVGHSGSDIAFGIALDDSNNVFITGSSTSTTYPLVNAYQSSYGGSQDAFVTKLTRSGNAIRFSTFLGGTGADVGRGIVVSSSRRVYVTGRTASTGFPTATASGHTLYDATHNGSGDAFVTKMEANGSALIYSTFIGGSSDDYARAIALAPDSTVYITGRCGGNTFPTTTGAYDVSFNGTADVYVLKLDAFGQALVFSTYLGGSGDDFGQAIALDDSLNAYVTGYTADAATDMTTTTGAYNTTHNGSTDVFVAKLNSSGTTLRYCTFLGGSGEDWGWAIKVDANRNAYITGFTTDSTTDMPTTTGAYDTTANGSTDAFMAEINSTGSTLLYSTFIGGSGQDKGYGLVRYTDSSVAICGSAASGFPTTSGAYDATANGGLDAFVSKIGSTAVTITSPNSGETWCAGSTQTITWTQGGITNLKLQLSTDGGTSWGTTIIASTSASTGSYSWTIPTSQAAGTTYRVRAVNTADTTIADASNANFTIRARASLAVTLSPTIIMDADHTLRTITATASASNGCSPSVTLLSVTSSEPDGSTSPGDVAGDIAGAATGTNDLTFQVRAERADTGRGRAYHITYRVTDNGTTTDVTQDILVPRHPGTVILGGTNTCTAALPASLSDMTGSSISIPFTLGSASTGVTLSIYDGRGKEVARLLNNVALAAGVQSANWNGVQSVGVTPGGNAPNGTYMVVLRSCGYTDARTLRVNR